MKNIVKNIEKILKEDEADQAMKEYLKKKKEIINKDKTVKK